MGAKKDRFRERGERAKKTTKKEDFIPWDAQFRILIFFLFFSTKLGG